MVQKVDAYKTSDEVVFLDKKEAAEHEAIYSLEQLIAQKVSRSDAQEVVRVFLNDHGDTVLKLLQRIYPDES